MSKKILAIFLGCLLMLLVAGCNSSQTSNNNSIQEPNYGKNDGQYLPEANDARNALSQLSVKNKDSFKSYSRTEFGEAWHDPEHPVCNTRNRVLKRDLDNVKYSVGRGGVRGCVVSSGVLKDPYTGKDVNFDRRDSQAVQIDHVVALADAWRSGAKSWDKQKRQRFANDMTELLASQAQANSDKGNSDADQWMPPNQSHHCDYGKRQVFVKANYGLSVTKKEKSALEKALASCNR